MKLKYFLRGLGIGIIFASVIFLTAYQGNVSQNITDEEIMRRAKTLGMVEKEDRVAGLISDSTEKDKEGKRQEKTEVSTEVTDSAQEQGKEDRGEKTTQTTGKETEDDTSEQESSEEKKQDAGEKETVSLTISGGATSYPVCQKLQELGMIRDAQEFDTYLVENGYADRIKVGTHTLTLGMSFHEIAEAISDPL